MALSFVDSESYGANNHSSSNTARILKSQELVSKSELGQQQRKKIHGKVVATRDWQKL